MQLSPKFKKLSSFCLAILPACFLALLISIYSVNVPYGDHWGIAPLFEKLHNYSFSFSDLLVQHNESRLLFPKFVFIFLAYLTHWNVKYEVAFTFFIACIISLNIYYLSKLTINGSIVKRLSVAAIANLLIFAPIQWENWLWGMQMIVFIPIACVTTCVLVAYSRLAAKSKFLISICLATISTFSYANGILCWIVVFPVLILKSRKELFKNRWLVFSWISCFILNIVAYFNDYKKPSYHPSFLEALAHPQKAIYYFLSFIGAPLAFGSGIAAPVIGFVLILLFSSACIYLLRFSKDSALLHRMAGWLTIGLYTLSSATITTLGRVGFGVEQSLSSRYTTFSVYLAVSLVYIITIIADDINKKYLLKTKKLATQFIYSLTAVTLVLHLLTSASGIQLMSNTRVERLRGKSCLLFINFVQEECLSKNVFPDVNYLKSTANAIDSLGFLKPSLVKNSRIQDIEGDQNFSSENYGSLGTLTQISIDMYSVSGWAVLPEREEPADAVILTYEKVDGESTIFTVVDTRTNIKSNDVAKALKSNPYSSNLRWQKDFSSIKFPKGAIKINAWAFDSNIGKAFKLNGTYVIHSNSQANIAIAGVKSVKEIDFKVTSNSANGFFNGLPDGSSGPKVEIPKATPFNVSGWAILSDENRAADLVIITYGDSNSLLALAPVNLERPDVVKALNNPAYKNSGWSTKVNPANLPNDKVLLKAWAYNSARKQATLLNNSLQVVLLD